MGEEKDDKNTDLVIDFGSKLAEALGKSETIELNDVEIELGELQLRILPGVAAPSRIAVAKEVKPKPTTLIEAGFDWPKLDYTGEVVEVKIGATKKEGGTRIKPITLGGEKTTAFTLFDKPMPNPPVIAFDVFDTRIPLAKAVKEHYKDVMEDPVEWAKLCVKKFKAESLNLHLVSIDPLSPKPATPKEAAKMVEDVLQAVKVPLAIGGCGDPVTDLKVFKKVCEVAEGERLLINSVTLDMDIEATAKAVKKYGHTVIAFTSMDLNQARELNNKLYDFIPREDIVMDTTTAALGYGLDYAFTIMERARIAACKGDASLQHPLSSGTTNAWAAREAWMKLPDKWNPRNLRGPIWETVSALTLLLAGVDYFMMMHPSAAQTVKEVFTELRSKNKGKPEEIENWVTMKM